MGKKISIQNQNIYSKLSSNQKINQFFKIKINYFSSSLMKILQRDCISIPYFEEKTEYLKGFTNFLDILSTFYHAKNPKNSLSKFNLGLLKENLHLLLS